MTFHIVTIFPEIFSSYFNTSILKRAQEKGVIKMCFYNPRNFAKDKHKSVDDRPYGGGPGMVMKAAPVIGAVRLAKSKISSKLKIIIFSPRGKQFTQEMARNWSKRYKNIIMICGHYEGIDERIKKILKASLPTKASAAVEEISAGPFVLTGGELPAMIVVDTVSRHIAGVLGKKESLEESRENSSAPVYTRPETILWKSKKYKVPKVLLSGSHKKINTWRKKYSR